MTTHKAAPWRQVRRHRGGTERGSCPPHTSIMVSASEEGYYSASCLACGLAGPKREDAREHDVTTRHLRREVASLLEGGRDASAGPSGRSAATGR